MIKHLHDVAGLEALERIARNHDVDLVARGGLARRLYALAVRQPTAKPDLFDLLPFTADIDLTHTGGPELTVTILRAIRREVPLAECFRWDVRPAEAAAESRLVRAYGPIVPLHAVTIGVRTGFEDSMNARNDLLNKRHRYVRNPAYRDSPRFQAGQDLEVFGAMRYLRTIFEDDAVDLTDMRALDEVRATFTEAASQDTLGRLQESADLRGRMHDLLKSIAVAARTQDARGLLEILGVRAFVAFVDGEREVVVPPVEPPGVALAESADAPDSIVGRGARFRSDLDPSAISAITASDRLRGDLCRLPARIPFYWPTVPLPGRATNSPLHLVRDEAFAAPGIRTLRVSPWIALTPGKSASSRAEDGEINEMIHFALIADGDPGNEPSPPDEDVGVTMLFRRGIAPDAILVASPLATCVSRPYERVEGSPTTVRSFRLACGTLIERLLDSDEGGTLHVAFIVSARDVGEQDSDNAWSESATPVVRDDFTTAPAGVA